MARIAQIERKTSETQIRLALNLDGKGVLSGENPIPFFAHMLGHVAKYSLFDIELFLRGDIEIDCHHSVEDTAIVLGQALSKALGNKAGIFRYGSFTLPMDEVLTTVTVDLSGRPYFVYRGEPLKPMGKFGIYDSELTLEFLHKLSIHAAMNLHVQVHYGENRHHIHESIFKALGFALRQAVALDARRSGEIPSTKGTLS
ncbi:MAG: imidazoleglycerol-phosphate dehydratase HisB [Turneriella sp.]|nr:imidazoleglycerol-phosphate dehydratase HisB [Leptospiraceae bacterium]MCX7632317.1 imidazoleglycerol-phosphate dehydratase HisB [Turneriella sp.]